MDKLAIGLKLAPEEIADYVRLHKKLSEAATKSDMFYLQIEEKEFIKDLLNKIIQASVAKASRLESIGNDFLSSYELARNNH